jgi:hypothetical protein
VLRRGTERIAALGVLHRFMKSRIGSRRALLCLTLLDPTTVIC